MLLFSLSVKTAVSKTTDLDEDSSCPSGRGEASDTNGLVAGFRDRVGILCRPHRNFWKSGRGGDQLQLGHVDSDLGYSRRYRLHYQLAWRMAGAKQNLRPRRGVSLSLRGDDRSFVVLLLPGAANGSPPAAGA